MVARFFAALWTDGTLEEHTGEARAILAGTPASTMPLVVLVAELEGEVVGLVEVGLRSHADGCDTSRAVGFLEGWYVEPEHRRKGVGAALVRAVEDWSRAQGCRELASDTWIDNPTSERAHVTLGFEIVDRCVHFKKAL